MKKRLFGILLGSALLASMGVTANAETYEWSFSTTYVSGSVVVQMYQRFAELANEYTDGAITINVFPDGTIATEDDALAQVSSGELEFCGTGTALFLLTARKTPGLTAPS